MNTVYHELLPHSYLLLLLPGPTHTDADEPALAQALHCASRSGKQAVWVDCELVTQLSTTSVRMLWDYHHHLQQQRVKLVLVHPCAELQEQLSTSGSPELCFAADLCDAAWHSGLSLVA